MVAGLPIAKIGAMLAQEGIKKSRDQSIQLFHYDFVGLIIKILVIYLAAWIGEWYLKGRLFFDDPDNQRRVGLSLLGISGVVINLLWDYYGQKKAEGETIRSIPSDKLKLLLGDGIEVGGFRLKYWDIVNVVVNLLVIVEALQYYEREDQNGGTPSPMTMATFIVIIGVLALATLPNIMDRVKKLNFSLEAFK